MENFRGMSIFVHVVNSGSFSAAARQLGITKSAVSQQVTQLEDQLGTRLLHRSTRNLNLTEEGATYLQGCRQMVEAAEEANASLSQLKTTPSGTLRLTCSIEFSAHFLVPIIKDYLTDHPKMNIELLAEDQVVNMVEEGVDLALRIGELKESSLIARKLGQLELVLCAAPSYLEQFGTPQSPEELTEHNWLAFTQLPTPTQLQLQHPSGQELHIRLSGRVRSNNTLSIRQMLLSGIGISQAISYLVQKELQNGKLVRLLPEYNLPVLGLYAVYPRREHVPLKVRLFIDYILQAMSIRKAQK